MKRAAVAALALSLAWPALAFAQAEPAPEGYRPPNAPPSQPPPAPGPSQTPEVQPMWRLALAPHLAVRFGEAPPGLPRIGYGAGVEVTRALVPFGAARFGVGFDFAYDRFAHEKQVMTFGASTQFVGHATFAALAVVDGYAGRVRPWLAVGGGFSVENYEDPAVASGSPSTSEVAVVGLVKLAAGLGVRIYQQVELGLRGDFTLTFSSHTVGAPPKDVFAPGYFSLGLDIAFRF